VLRSVAFNAAHGESSVALFEQGTVFAPPRAGEPLPVERRALAFARSHEAVRAPHEPNRAVDVYDATAVLYALAQELRLADVRLVAATVDGFHATRAARILVDGEPVGVVGQVADEVVDALSLTGPVVAAEVDVDALLAGDRVERASKPISRFPASTVDLAFVVDERVPAADIRATLLRAGGELLEDVSLFDVFRSASVGAGKVSLAFALRFRAPDRTLTDDEVGTLRRAGIDAVASEHGASLRT
jgi:phenylalanyl-tRNA synthetase beta chain